MIYDCFIFFNELDILEIRMNILNDVIDKFVLVESPLTFHGKSKPLIYTENQSRFAQFSDKIIHIVSSPPTQQVGDTEQVFFFQNHQRDAIMQGLTDCCQDDVVLISDVDEIPRPEKVLAHRDSPGIKVFEHKLSYYYLNMQCCTAPTWRGTRMGRLANLLDPAQDLPPHLAHTHAQKGLPTYFRLCDGLRIKDGGWHFSYCGGAEAIMKKIHSISGTRSGQLADIVAKMDAAGVQRAIARGEDIFGRAEFFYVPIGLNELPQYVQENTAKYSDLILFREPLPSERELVRVQNELAQAQNELAQAQNELAQAQRILSHPAIRAQRKIWKLIKFWK